MLLIFPFRNECRRLKAVFDMPKPWKPENQSWMDWWTHGRGPLIEWQDVRHVLEIWLNALVILDTLNCQNLCFILASWQCQSRFCDVFAFTAPNYSLIRYNDIYVKSHPAYKIFVLANYCLGKIVIHVNFWINYCKKLKNIHFLTHSEQTHIIGMINYKRKKWKKKQKKFDQWINPFLEMKNQLEQSSVGVL